ncbi:hypothetical protein FA13DRAFT_1807907 [Coprinellus micaceus]|uniref:Uncharacterized protein n=1 Tax=Coprinellus micaceus TaxID=71717 RepID=A0A4Y7TYZ0_COPMI|nr:hypothetical protein FA13DRAFT_1807907 [Coprinellus micaceus]
MAKKRKDLETLLDVLLEPPDVPDEEPVEDRFTDIERHQLQSYRQQMQDLEKKRDDLLLQYEQNENEITMAQRRYGTIRNATSAIQKLPDELLVSIFLAVVEEGKVTGVLEWFLPEVVISRVCSRWRNLALSTPPLWNFFCSGSDVTGTLRGVVRAERLEEYFNRSKNGHLDLWLDFTFCEAEPIRALAKCLQAASEASKLEALITNFTGEDFGPQFGPPATLSSWTPNILLSGAPKLEFLQLDENSIHLFRPPLTSLVHLRLEVYEYSLELISFDCSTFHDILTLPRLQTLSIWGDYIQIDPERYLSFESIITTNSLRHFRCDGETLPQHFLSHVSAPSLESFSAYRLNLSNHGLANTTCNRLPALQSLALYHPKLTPTDTPKLLEVMATAGTVTNLVIAEMPQDALDDLPQHGSTA